MPRYDYDCPKCNHKEIDVIISWDKSDGLLCSVCGSILLKRVSVGVAADIFPSSGIFLEHVSEDGKRFYSKQEMRDFEKRYGMTIGMLH